MAGTDDDVIYQTHRFSTNGFLSYVIPVAEAGTYDVTLHFAETFYGQPGNPAAAANQRVFNVLLQNEAVLEEFDLSAIRPRSTPGTRRRSARLPLRSACRVRSPRHA